MPVSDVREGYRQVEQQIAQAMEMLRTPVAPTVNTQAVTNFTPTAQQQQQMVNIAVQQAQLQAQNAQQIQDTSTRAQQTTSSGAGVVAQSGAASQTIQNAVQQQLATSAQIQQQGAQAMQTQAVNPVIHAYDIEIVEV